MFGEQEEEIPQEEFEEEVGLEKEVEEPPATEPVKERAFVSLCAYNEKNGNIIDNNYQQPAQDGYERYVSENNPTGRH